MLLSPHELLCSSEPRKLSYFGDDGHRIDVIGLDNRKKLYVSWTQADLRSGNEVLIKIVDRKDVDKEEVIRRHNEKRDLEPLKRGVKQQAKALGFEIREKRTAK